MDKNNNSAGAVSPVKNSRLSRSKSDDLTRNAENSNPNSRSPSLMHSSSPSNLIKSASKSQKSAKKKPSTVPNPVGVAPPMIKEKVRERKFLIAKKKNTKKDKVNPSTTPACVCDSKDDGKLLKCRCVVYESLRASQDRASQDQFFKNNSCPVDEGEKEFSRRDEMAESGVESKHTDDEDEKVRHSEIRVSDFNMKRRRDKLLEDARESLPESGRVMHLVKAFETLLRLPKSMDFQKNEYN